MAHLQPHGGTTVDIRPDGRPVSHGPGGYHTSGKGLGKQRCYASGHLRRSGVDGALPRLDAHMARQQRLVTVTMAARALGWSRSTIRSHPALPRPVAKLVDRPGRAYLYDWDEIRQRIPKKE